MDSKNLTPTVRDKDNQSLAVWRHTLVVRTYLAAATAGKPPVGSRFASTLAMSSCHSHSTNMSQAGDQHEADTEAPHKEGRSGDDIKNGTSHIGWS